jgi:DNA-binding NtrC family response regulator
LKDLIKMKKNRNTILLIEDEDILRITLTDELEDANYNIISVCNPNEALKTIENNQLDAVVTDFRLDDRMNGIDILEFVKKYDPSIAVVLMTAYGTVSNAVDAMKKGADDYLTKPFEPEELIMVLKRVIKIGQLEKENIQLKMRLATQYNLNNLVNESPQMRDLSKKIPIVASSNEIVLLTGETGTGKNRLAATIHELSDRKTKPFVEVSCASLSPQLLESELFGHEKGSFTGASSRKIGKFENANEGTLLLDEVDDIPLELQVKILRFIQEKEFERVGGVSAIKVDVRIIAATKKNLMDIVNEGLLREDLYYRLNVIPIDLPPLRERKEDIPILANKFLSDSCPAFETVELEPDVMEVFVNYSWPGNIRELKHIVKRLVLMGQCQKITMDMVPKELLLDNNKLSFDLNKNMNYEQIMSNVEKELLENALKKASGIKSKAAELLNLKLSTFRDKLGKYNLL